MRALPAPSQVAARYAPLWPILNVIGLGVLVVAWIVIPGTGFDATNYHSVDFADPYGVDWYAPGSFVYSPAFAQAIAPLTLLPLAVFAKLLLAVNLACLGWLLGPAWAAASLALLPVTSELHVGNVHLPLAAMLAVGLRYPAAWAFGILSKVTPGVALLWFASRGDWHRLGVAVGATAAIVAISFATWPSAWLEWFDVLRAGAGREAPWYTLNEMPALWRIPIAAVVTVAAARRNRPAALPLIVLFSLPAVWFSAIVLIAAIPRIASRNAAASSAA